MLLYLHKAYFILNISHLNLYTHIRKTIYFVEKDEYLCLTLQCSEAEKCSGFLFCSLFSACSRNDEVPRTKLGLEIARNEP